MEPGPPNRIDGDQWTITVAHGHQQYRISISPDAVMQTLREAIAAVSGVDVARQTAITFKSADQKLVRDPRASIAAAGVTNEAKIMLVGTTSAAEKIFMEAEHKLQRREQTLATARNMMQTLRHQEQARTQHAFGFRSLAPLPGYAAPFATTAEAHTYLHNLASDHAILQIMRERRWTVGVLSEFAPSAQTGMFDHSQSCLLGFNRNRGQEISLRLRTDNLVGFNYARLVTETLLHELAHMEVDDHNADFHALHRSLIKDYARYRSSANILGGSQTSAIGGPSSLDPPPAQDWQSATALSSGRALGGGGERKIDSPRAMAGLAAIMRLSESEQRQVLGCGRESHNSLPDTGATGATDATSTTDAHIDPSSGDRLGQVDAVPSDSAPRHFVDVFSIAAEAEEAVRGRNPYEYRPRRSLQVAIPAFEGPASAAAAAAEQDDRDELVVSADEIFSPELPVDAAFVSAVDSAVEKLVGSSDDFQIVDQCFKTIEKLLENILSHPVEPKFRTVKLKNKLFHDTVGRLSRAVEFLELVGFQNATSDDGNRLLSLPVSAELTQLRHAWLVVTRARVNLESIL